MATNQTQMRCVACGHVDYPRPVRRGAGWVALLLWAATAAAWVGSWYGLAGILSIVFWALLLAAMLYTIWYFSKQETACRSCGERELEAHTHAGE